MPFFDSDHAKIFYEDVGEAASSICLTLVNGYTRSSSDFKSMARSLAEKGIRVLTLDNRCSGQTVAPNQLEFRQLVEDVENLWRFLRITKSSLLGISMGGVIAQNLAARKKIAIDKLLLISTTCSERYFLNKTTRWGDSLEEVEATLRHYFHPHFLKRNLLLFRAMAKQIWKNIEEGDYTARASSQLDAMQGHYDTTALLQEIDSQTLVIHGDSDAVISSDAAKAIHEAIKDSQLKIYNEAGHLLLAEKPKELLVDVLGFLRA